MPRDLPADIGHPHVPTHLLRYNVALSEFLQAHPEYQGLATGSLILRGNPKTDKTEILLLKRASTDSYPNAWEPPGGAVDAEDKSIIHAVVRELWEETGLRVKGLGTGGVVRDNAGERYYSGNSVEENREFAEITLVGRRGEKWCKLNFLVDIQADKSGDLRVELDELEHQDWGWFDEDAVKRLLFANEQAREIISNAIKRR